MNERKGVEFKEVLTGILALIIGTIALKYADLPTRVSVLETQQVGVMETLKSMDKKLDIALRRVK